MIYQQYKSIEYFTKEVTLPDSLKIAGIGMAKHPNFSNIDYFHEKYASLFREKEFPYVELGIGIYEGDKGDYYFGCQVKCLDGLPDELFSYDTGLTRYFVVTFRCVSTEELVGGEDGPGRGMSDANDYIDSVWLPENKQRVNLLDAEHILYGVNNGKNDYYTGVRFDL